MKLNLEYLCVGHLKKNKTNNHRANVSIHEIKIFVYSTYRQLVKSALLLVTTQTNHNYYLS